MRNWARIYKIGDIYTGKKIPTVKSSKIYFLILIGNEKGCLCSSTLGLWPPSRRPLALKILQD